MATIQAARWFLGGNGDRRDVALVISISGSLATHLWLPRPGNVQRTYFEILRKGGFIRERAADLKLNASTGGALPMTLDSVELDSP
ncbi:hypothetical protein EVAR_54280_1 [Eumeta japonica]|uniref:Uncharacterized protein n=1 Tax=Eumeta variegata TaxID=151549 RepID=A0A4C1YU08_EUMVA|nr:hypothetical protein EVAR_54280_1 [Eumeta japonica]